MCLRGPVCARVHREGGRVVAVDFVNFSIDPHDPLVPGFLLR